MKKRVWGLLTVSAVGVVSAAVHFATLPPAPPAVPPVPDKIAIPNVPALTPYDLPTGQVPVSKPCLSARQIPRPLFPEWRPTPSLRTQQRVERSTGEHGDPTNNRRYRRSVPFPRNVCPHERRTENGGRGEDGPSSPPHYLSGPTYRRPRTRTRRSKNALSAMRCAANERNGPTYESSSSRLDGRDNGVGQGSAE